MFMLKYFGSQGGICLSTVVKDGLGIGKGSVMNYVNQSVIVQYCTFATAAFSGQDQRRGRQ
jgi:hypothetical protein